jgi:coniferyl-aldehyde dehydrogenase
MSVALASQPPVSESELSLAFERLKAGYRADPVPSYADRMDRLARLAKMLVAHQDEIVKAICQDYGNRSAHETRIAEILMLLDDVRYTRKNLNEWMKPQSRHVALTYLPGQAKVHLQPKGVVGVIAPWNYPVQLALAPTAAALAAGNRVLIKPSEYTPATAELLKKLCAETFPKDLVDVVTGGPEVGEAFWRLPFDHLLYTGSTHVGRMVMRAAAENLVPVTLELGGKSPTIVHEDYPVEKAAQSVAWGKWTNAGQTCIAPDYLLVPEKKVGAFVDALGARVRSSFPSLEKNPDYTCVINERHYRRVKGLVDDAVGKGAKKVEINPAGEPLPAESRKIAPTMITDVTDQMKVMQEEIFGPVLPIMGYRTLDDAIAYVNDHPRPLALYYFDRNQERVQRVLERTVSGGASINETLLHFGIDDMPFGGVGPSGLGAYHGREGFETFSHKKSVFYQARWNASSLLLPPYGARIEKLLKFLIG